MARFLGIVLLLATAHCAAATDEGDVGSTGEALTTTTTDPAPSSSSTTTDVEDAKKKKPSGNQQYLTITLTDISVSSTSH